VTSAQHRLAPGPKRAKLVKETSEESSGGRSGAGRDRRGAGASLGRQDKFRLTTPPSGRASVTRSKAPSRAIDARFLRGVAGLTTEQLARRLRVEPGAVERWERGEAPMAPAVEQAFRCLVRTRARAALLRSRPRGEWQGVPA
jgi:DNA-binding transcriptional regulator YiaG